MRTIALSIITIALFTACSATRVDGHWDGKHHGVGAKTNLLKF